MDVVSLHDHPGQTHGSRAEAVSMGVGVEHQELPSLKGFEQAVSRGHR
jgi:hypothetical protein